MSDSNLMTVPELMQEILAYRDNQGCHVDEARHIYRAHWDAHGGVFQSSRPCTKEVFNTAMARVE